MSACGSDGVAAKEAIPLVEPAVSAAVQQPSDLTRTPDDITSPALVAGSTSVVTLSVTPSPTPVATPLSRNCTPNFPDYLELSYESLVEASMQIAQAGFECAEEVGLAFARDDAAIAAIRNRGVSGPLLLADSLTESDLANELERLAPVRVVVAGFNSKEVQSVLANFDVEVVAVQRLAADHELEALPIVKPTVEPTVEAELTAEPSEDLEPSTSTDVLDQTPDQALDEMESTEPIWIVSDPELEPILGVVAQQVEASVLVVDGDLPTVSVEIQRALLNAAEVKVMWATGSGLPWPIDTMRDGSQIPGGGLLMFDGSVNRRLVAIYGHPSGPQLGVLGEQGIEAGIERLKSIAQGYEADGSVVLPTFEIIATVASAYSGADGNYSSETPRDKLRPWIEAAAVNDVYVVLDLQPGRTDYLAQAKIYEEFLRMPHVGLALDPEWRLKPNELHMRQVGTVDAAEINQVVDWLASIVREENLPQKLLILHQFSQHMITNRDQVRTPPELAVLIHMDGHGSFNAKHSTWTHLTGLPDAVNFHWGWKNFYDEDSPTPTPAQVLTLAPKAVYVSYQ